MVNMKMSQEEAAEYSGSMLSDAPQYPYGLRICLDDDAISKLGFAALPAVEQTMMILAKVKVISVSSNQRAGGDKEDSIELQITDMEISPDNSGKSSADKLYGS